MGIERTDYVVVGVKIKYDELEKKFKIEDVDELEGITTVYDADIGDLTCISDCMNGEYEVLGIIADKGVEEDGQGLDMNDCLREYNLYKGDVIYFLEQNNLKELIPKISVYAFTYYS